MGEPGGEIILRFQCKVCRNLYESQAELAEHVLVKHGVQSLCFPSFSCRVCNIQFVLESDYYGHNCELMSKMSAWSNMSMEPVSEDQVQEVN